MVYFKKTIKYPGKTFCEIIIALTPFLVIKPTSALWWGEINCPSEILEDIKTKKEY